MYVDAFVCLLFAATMLSSSFGHACAGRSSLADDILSNKFKEIAPIFGSKIDGKDKFKSTIDGLFSVSSTTMPISTVELL